ncbi:DUF6113 family protein [Streptomyces abyssomicinicus]|uniref:DUF6113 family protein n=1 Tax=Streptomyces abyssomicinicus TaxID=574929 RepID=UPI00124FE16E|nr:DUF6113 family protein [Streptomyces abyssomicinicus]
MSLNGGVNDKGPRPAAGSPLAQPLRLPSAGRTAAYAGLFLCGALVGVAGALVQAAFFPGGLLLALAGAAGTFLGGSRLMASRAGAAVPVAGWLVAVVLLTTSRPEGDFVFGASLRPYLFLLGGIVVAMICATLGGGRNR